MDKRNKTYKTHYTCKHKWVSCMEDVVMGGEVVMQLPIMAYHEGLERCESWKSENFTNFNGCSICEIIYRDSNTFSKIASL